MATRMYLVELKKKKILVEATSREAAVQAATASMVKSVTIPTPLEVARYMSENVEVLSKSIPAAPSTPSGEEGGSAVQGAEGVGSSGMRPADDDSE